YKIILYQIPIEKEIIRIEYDFFDRLSELEFYSENSNVYQKHLFQYLTQTKFDMEKSKLELALLKQRITHNHLPTSFDTLEISIPRRIHTIIDTETAQSLKDRYDKILQRTKADMIQVYLEAAEVRANQCRLEFNNAMNKLKENESTHLSDKILTKVIPTDINYISGGDTVLTGVNYVLDGVIGSVVGDFELDGPRFIFNDPQTASRRRKTELATLRRKIETRFFEKKVSPGRPVQLFIDELDILLQNLHNTSTINNGLHLNRTINQNKSNDIIILSQPQINIRSITKKINYRRLIKRLKLKFRLTNTVIRKTDKSKVFHLGKIDDYRRKSIEYMNKTNAYQCLGTHDPLPDLIQRTNKYLLELRLAKWITQKQYEQLCIKEDEVELAHLYYLPKPHKPQTPLRPITAGLKHPTIKISKFLDDLLRPLFDKMAANTTVTCGFELIKKLQQWSNNNMKQ
ncbi:unnamed protein product, partial [Rotaria sordida]